MFSFDPALGGTGFAVIDQPERKVVDLGLIRPHTASKKMPVGAQIAAMMCVGRELCQLRYTPERSVLRIVEMPRKKAQGLHEARNVAHLPTYGVVVGAFAYGLPFPVCLIHVDDWAPAYPKTYRDRYKSKRVEHAALLYDLNVEDFGPTSAAGNVADALLMADYARESIESLTIHGTSEEGPHP
jgi:hypothetical protein